MQGRTGRIGNRGVATSLVTNLEPMLRDIVIQMEKQASSEANVAQTV